MKRSYRIFRRLFLFLILFLICCKPVLFSQCTNGTQPECKCATAPVLCTIDQLDGYTFSMAAFQHPNDGPSPICSGGNMNQTNNPTWFAFTAWCTDLKLRVTSTNCHRVGGFIGYQLAIYSDCTFSHLIACNADVNDCNTNAKILNLTGLSIGSIYYFMVDGCLGSYCTVTIDIIGVCGQEHIAPWTMPVDGNTDPCAGDSETYTVENLNGARIYHWFIDGVLKGQTTTENFNILWSNPGTYELCIDASNDPCVDISDPPLPLCTTITVHGTDAGVLTVTPEKLCTNELSHISNTGFTSGIGNGQFVIITDTTGSILEVRPGGTFNLFSDTAGIFTVYAYNYLIPGGTIPVIGGNISDIDCSTRCCDLKSQIITFHQIQAVVNNILCNDHGTGNNANDDVFTFTVLVTGQPAGMAWQSTNGIISGVYGASKLCGPFPISGGTLHFDIQDLIEPACTTSITVDPPMACSLCIQTMDAGTSGILNCTTTETTLTGISSSTGIYHWTGPNTFSSDSLSCVVRDSGWYYLNIDFGNMCKSTDSVYVDQDLETPTANAGADQQLDCNHQDVILDASGSTGNNYTLQWTSITGNIISTQTVVLIDSMGTYVLMLTNSNTGCTSFDSASVMINEDELGSITVVVGNENCLGDEDGEIEVTNISGGAIPYAYTINNMANNTTGQFDHLAPGSYDLHISDANGCAVDTTIIILAGVDLQANLPENIHVTSDQNGAIHANINVPLTEISSVQWTPPGVVACDTCLSTFINTDASQVLTVTIVDIRGCVATAQTQILAFPSPKIYIPNTFSPNGDGYNDQFTIYANEAISSIIELNIFDRWGDNVFQALNIPTNNVLLGWDGKFHHQEMPSGTFVFTLKLQMADGSEKSMTGDVTLVR
ncbi:MAG: gliding motility-associated C-terminal domain-containing protein [Saprospiraceae bacterium]